MTLQHPMFPPPLPRAEPAGAPGVHARPSKRPKSKKRTTPRPAKPTPRPGDYVPVMTPEQFYENLGKLRREAEVVIEKMIALVDAIDAPDEDREDDDAGGPGDEDDEPCLASSHSIDQSRWAPITRDGGVDMEDEHDGREDGGDDEPDLDNEPWLGASEPLEHPPGAGSVYCGKFVRITDEERMRVYDQGNWSSVCDHEGDDDHDTENVRTDPVKLAKARDRYRVEGSRLAITTGSDGRLMQASRGCGRSNVSPLTSVDRQRLGL